MPFSLKVVLENLLRNEDGRTVKKEDIEAVYSIIDNFMMLPDNLEKKFELDMDRIAEEKTMPFVSTLERIYRKRGIKYGLEKGLAKGEAQGRVKGLEAGRVEGRVEATREYVVEILRERFDRVPDKIVKAVFKIDDAAELKKLLI